MANVENYFVSDPGGHDLPGTYPTMEQADAVAAGLSAEIEEEREAAGRDPQAGGRYVSGAHFDDGTSTFEIG